jgi:Antitoxin ParD.
MSRLTIEVTEQQHQTLKARAALEGKTIKQYTLERLFPSRDADERALADLKELLAERVAQAERGELVEARISDIAEQTLRSGN